jgi:hypothetical protein
MCVCVCIGISHKTHIVCFDSLQVLYFSKSSKKTCGAHGENNSTRSLVFSCAIVEYSLIRISHYLKEQSTKIYGKWLLVCQGNKVS